MPHNMWRAIGVQLRVSSHQLRVEFRANANTMSVGIRISTLSPYIKSVGLFSNPLDLNTHASSDTKHKGPV